MSTSIIYNLHAKNQEILTVQTVHFGGPKTGQKICRNNNLLSHILTSNIYYLHAKNQKILTVQR